MEHYFDLSTKNETADVWTENFENFENLKIQGIIPDTIWPLSNDELYNHEKYMQLVMLFLVLFFLVRKLSKYPDQVGKRK